MVLNGPRQFLEHTINVFTASLSVQTYPPGNSQQNAMNDLCLLCINTRPIVEKALNEEDEQICMEMCKLCSAVGESGVDVIATDHDDVIEFMLPEDVITNYTVPYFELTPESGSFDAVIDGGGGDNSLVLSDENMPKGYHYSVQYNDDARDSGVVYLELKDEQLYELIAFKNITILNAPDVHIASASDDVFEPILADSLPEIV